MYEWYQEYYVGAAHGLAGIYYYLMQPSLQVNQGKLHSLVKPSVDFVCRLKFPSGNYPPCLDDTRDLLVHWCHGAPGVIYMLIQAYKVFKEERYLCDAQQCADVIWQYGLLKKGYGLPWCCRECLRFPGTLQPHTGSEVSVQGLQVC